jgi:hypothetical protein
VLIAENLNALGLRVSSPITPRVYNRTLAEFIEWFVLEPPAWLYQGQRERLVKRLETRGLRSVSLNVRITVVRKLAVEAADNGLLAPELAAGITRMKESKGVRIGNWLSLRQAQALLDVPDTSTNNGLRDRARLPARLPFAAVRGRCLGSQAYPATGQPRLHHRFSWESMGAFARLPFLRGSRVRSMLGARSLVFRRALSAV